MKYTLILFTLIATAPLLLATEWSDAYRYNHFSSETSESPSVSKDQDDSLSAKSKTEKTEDLYREAIEKYFGQHIRGIAVSDDKLEIHSDGNVFQVVSSDNKIKSFKDTFHISKSGESFTSNFRSKERFSTTFVLSSIASSEATIQYRVIHFDNKTLHIDKGILLLNRK